MTNPTLPPVENQQEMIQIFPREDGTISIWDHPNFTSTLTLPDSYYPLTRLEQGLELYLQGKINEEMVTVLKVVGDAISANENQLRRYLAPKMSASITSKHLRYLTKYGLVERHKCRLKFIEEDGKEVIRPPGPHTLGIGGYKLISHLYPESSFTSPESWQRNPFAIQKYAAVNEIRCLGVESGNVRGWTWYPSVGGFSRYKKPLAVMKVDTPSGQLQVIIERAQMAQNFIAHFQTRLHELRYLHDRDKFIHIDGHPKTEFQVVAISVSSVSMANFLREQLRLHTFPFDIWFVIDEWFDEEKGLETAIGQITKTGIQRGRVPFLAKKKV